MQSDALAARAGAFLRLHAIVVRDPAEVTDPEIPRDVISTDAAAALDGADLVIELFGGIEPARTLIRQAFQNGASVVTANKALLAAHGPELFEAADAAGVDLYYEAAVGGAIPIVRPMRESLAGDNVRRVLGIVNGTTNYVLDRMAADGLTLADAVAQAQALGYAEADPTADVEGHDAAAKAAILASLAFHTRVSAADVACEGIMAVTAEDVAWAARTGHVIKLLATAERVGEGVSAYVHPTLVPADHQLASVRGAFNAVFVEAESAGPLMFFGQGAGGTPTSSAVLGDLVSVARHRVNGGMGPRESAAASWPILPASAATTSFQIRLTVADRPGVLAQVAGALAEHGVSIDSVRQPSARQSAPSPSGATAAPATCDTDTTQLLITTHPATEAALTATVEAVATLDSVGAVVSVLRVLTT